MKKIIEKFEVFGRAFLVPVSVLPLVGIILGIGSGLSSKGLVEIVPFLQNNVIKFILNIFVDVGKATFDNLPLLFSVGLAIGLSKKEKGTAAIAGLVGYITFIYILSRTLDFRGLLVSKELMASYGQKVVFGKQVYDVNVFGGIMVGCLASYVTKNVIDKKMPEALSFFEGPRFVPFVTIISSIVLAIITSFIWPGFAKGITQMSAFLTGLGGIGAFFYGSLERILIPFGLHHGLNSLLKFTELGGSITYNGTTYAGYINMFAAALQNPEIVINSYMTKYYTGQYIVKIFGLTGAAFAMYKTALPKHRNSVKALLLGATLASVLTGITEPIEFTFLFVAPILYITHAILAGSAFFVAYVTNTVGLSIQGAGLINFFLYNVLNSNRVSWFGILVIGPIYFLLYFFVFKFIIIKFNLKTPGRDEEMTGLASKKEAREKYGIKSSKDKAENLDTKQDKSMGDLLIEAYGGVQNIEDVDACFTRLRINVKDKEKVNKDRLLKELGAKGIAESGNQVQAIYGGKAKNYKKEIREILGMEV